jgi:neutral trehalase
MESKTTSLFWKIVCTLGAWMLVLTVIQGLGLYYFVTRYTATKISVQTNTINRQTDRLIAEMKNFPSLEEVKNIRDNIDKIDKEMGTKIETMERDILKDLSPNLKITSQKPYFMTANQVKYIYAIQNKGRYAAIINNVKLFLSTTKIESPDRIKNQLTVNKDFYVITNNNIEDIAPGEEIKHDFTIEFPDSRKVPETIYYCVTLNAQTDPNIIKSVKTLDQDKIINKKPYYILGDIITPG